MAEPQQANDEGSSMGTRRTATESSPKEEPPPKAVLFEWCSKRKLAAPVIDMTAAPEGFGARVRIAVGSHVVESGFHFGRSIRIAQNAACADLLEQTSQLADVPLPTPAKPKESAEQIAAKAAARALREQEARAAAKKRLREERALAKKREREERLRVLLSAPSAAARQTLTELRHLQWVRSFGVDVQSRGRGLPLLNVNAWLELHDGMQIHMPPFVAANREDAERIAYPDLLESLARTFGVARERT